MHSLVSYYLISHSLISHFIISHSTDFTSVTTATSSFHDLFSDERHMNLQKKKEDDDEEDLNDTNYDEVPTCYTKKKQILIS